VRLHAPPFGLVQPVKVAFNGSQLLGPLTGLGQYSLQLARSMATLAEAEFHYFYLSHWSPDLAPREVAGLSTLKNLVKRWMPRPYELTRAIQQHAFTQGVRSFRPDLYHEPSFLPYRFDGPTVVTIHDLSWIRYPQSQPPERVRILDKLVPRAAAMAAQIIVDSTFVRDEIVSHYGVSPRRVAVIPLAARDVFAPRVADLRAATLRQLELVDGSYFLCVGTLEPRKNLQLALRAHALLPSATRQRVPLVISGARGWRLTELDGMMAGPVARRELIVPGFVDDLALADLYSGAVALLYPSRYEGFGLPPLEAMACGTPVILSDVASLPEVGGNVAVYHSPDDADAWAATMHRMLEDEAFRHERAQAALLQAARFSWPLAARKTLATYREALSNS
jgi:glycosyltransferase involved in cell wall biosynthesis